jgi:hypothetical protein
MIKKYIYIILLIVLANNIQAQQDILINAPMQGYIVDGQSYTLTISDGTKGKAYLTMFNGFDYRIHVSSKSIKKYKVSLFDIEKKVLFSSTCENYEKTNDIRFQSNFTGYIQIDVKEGLNESKNIDFNIIIGFKERKVTR